jgi:hypothetical protein
VTRFCGLSPGGWELEDMRICPPLKLALSTAQGGVLDGSWGSSERPRGFLDHPEGVLQGSSTTRKASLKVPRGFLDGSWLVSRTFGLGVAASQPASQRFLEVPEIGCVSRASEGSKRFLEAP